MSRKSDYRELMEGIRQAHAAFATAWAEARAAALKNTSPHTTTYSWENIWQANGVAYKAAEPLARRRDELLRELFLDHLEPLRDRFERGDPEAVDAIIDFLEVDVPAFRCGYAKEHYLRKLKTLPLTERQRERLRKYGLGLCRSPHHRRELTEAGRLMSRVADQSFIDELRTSSMNDNDWMRRKAAKMIQVVLNGRKDLS